MTEPNDNPPPIRFSLLRLIVIVNLIGLGVVPLRNAHPTLLYVVVAILIFSFAFAFINTRIDPKRRITTRRLAFESFQFAFRVTLAIFLVCALVLFIYQAINAPPPKEDHPPPPHNDYPPPVIDY